MSEVSFKQECIPVGCVPSAAVAIGGGSAPVHAEILPGGVCPSACWDTAQGVSAPVHAEILPGGSAPVHAGILPRVCVPQCMLGYTPPVKRITDACENITFPQLRCGR